MTSGESNRQTVSANAISKGFELSRTESVQALVSVNFEARAGEVVSIIGASGSGKSTLLYCLSGLEPVDSGDVSINGQSMADVSRTERSRIRRSNTGVIFQDYNLIDSMTVKENLEIGLKFAGVRHSSRKVKELLEQFEIFDKRNTYPSQLSGGQRQRVAIIRALSTNPSVIFADEPTGSLDSRASGRVIDELVRLADGGTTVVMVTHDFEVASVSDRAVLMVDGSIRAEILNPTADMLFEASKKFEESGGVARPAEVVRR